MGAVVVIFHGVILKERVHALDWQTPPPPSLSLTPMAITSWAPQGSKRWNWLQGYKEEYLAATDSSNLQEWLIHNLEKYFESFHWSIPDDADPETHPIRDFNTLSDPTEAERKQLEDEKTQAYVSKRKVRHC